MANYTAVAADANALVAEKKSWMAQNRAAAAALGVSGALLLALAVFYATSRSSDVFFEDFHSIDAARWTVERSLDDGGNGEFQAYTDDPGVIFVRSGRLVIQPKPMSADAWYQLSGLDAKLADPATPDADVAALHALRDKLRRPAASRRALGGDTGSRSRLHRARGGRGRGEIDLLEARGNDADFEVVGSSQSGKAGFDRLAATVHCADAGGGDTFSIGNTTIWPSQSNNFKALEDADGFVIIGLDWRPGSVRTYAREAGPRTERTLATWPGPRALLRERRLRRPPGRPAPSSTVISVAVGGSAGGGVAYWEEVLEGLRPPAHVRPADGGADEEAAWIPAWAAAFEVDWIA
ncbi:glycosyl hydrolase [Aureococcus anophagefferens]|nr:glycosyl hydrolase [Aureococcus anophagefferens]